MLQTQNKEQLMNLYKLEYTRVQPGRRTLWDRWRGGPERGVFTSVGAAERAWERDVLSRRDFDDIFRTRVVPLDWEEREELMFHVRFYTPPPWERDQFFKAWAISTHYAHISLKDPKMLAFTPTPEDGERDRQAIMKPGKYLQKYYGADAKTGLIKDGPFKGSRAKLTPQQIAYYAEWFERGSPPSPIDGHEIKFATTPEEMARIYIGGPRSCMGGASPGWSSGFRDNFGTVAKHPARVYAAGDLALAYIEDGKRIMVRALCWPDKKVFGRIYPAPQNYSVDGWMSDKQAEEVQQAVRQRFKEMGWTDVLEKADALDGARLLKVKLDERKFGVNTYLMPYLDNSYKFDAPAADEPNSEFFIMRLRGMHDAQHTSGYVRVVPMFRCACCGASVDERYKERVYSSWSQETGPADPTDMCSSCIRYGEGTWRCLGSDVRYSNKAGLRRRRVAGGYVLEAWAKANGGIYKCAIDGDAYLRASHPPLKLHDGREVNPQYLGMHVWQCSWNGEHYLHDDISEYYSGFPACMDDADISQLEREMHTFDIKRTTINKDGGWTVDYSAALARVFEAKRLARLDREASKRGVPSDRWPSVLAARTGGVFSHKPPPVPRANIENVDTTTTHTHTVMVVEGTAQQYWQVA